MFVVFFVFTNKSELWGFGIVAILNLLTFMAEYFLLKALQSSASLLGNTPIFGINVIFSVIAVLLSLLMFFRFSSLNDKRNESSFTA